MGNIEESKNKAVMLSQMEDESELNFYIEVDDPNLGSAKIYNCKKMPLCYILKQDRVINDSKIYNMFKTVESLQSTSLITLYGFKIRRNNCCSKIADDHLIAYWEYYNFYFSDYIKKRTKYSCLFVESELWHIVEVCSEGYSIFRKTGTYYDIDPHSMVITPEGKLKVCWGHLRSQNEHMKFLKYFDEGFSKNFFYSPEEIQCMYYGQRTTKLDFDKCNAFRLGMILLECTIMMDPLELCYNPSLTKINFNSVKSLINGKVAQSYSEDFVSFLRTLLKQNPKERPSLMEVYEKYSGFMSSQNELRVCGRGPNQNMKQMSSKEKELQRNKTDGSDTKTVKLSYSRNRKG